MTNIALFGDMHGNCVALDAVFADLGGREIDSMVCLGDAVQGGSQPAEVVERLRELDCPVVMGNSDSFVLTGSAGEGSVESLSEAQMQVREWTREQLGAEGLAFIESFSDTAEIPLADGSLLLCCHGSPRSFNEVILPEMTDEEISEALGGLTNGFVAGGHTHIQWVRRFGDRTFFNPGSAGVAYNRYMDPSKFYFYPIAQYAIVYSNPSFTHIEFCQVPFDVDAMELAARKSGRPFSESESSRYRAKQ